MRLFNTLTGRKEDFSPSGDEVKMYVCGVTPYDECHVGHAFSYIFFDVLRRYLEFRGLRVRHVQNFTDIDDKIIARAKLLGISPQELAIRYMERYFQDMDALNIKRAHYYPKVTEEIPIIIQLIRGLIDKGYAYEVGGDIYFRVSRFPEYGKLSKKDIRGLVAGARVEAGEGKEDPFDFALWKGEKSGEPWWKSPWGRGRPGWHIECSAISLNYLGETLDIHGGGQDLIFPHHENEIAQSEAFTGKPFARFFIHNGLVRWMEEKMSKSLGNLVTVREMLKNHGPDAFRLFCLSAHYRSSPSYSEEVMRAFSSGLERLRQAAYNGGVGRGRVDPSPYRERFINAMDDDLNTPQAVAVLFDLASEINKGRERGIDVEEARGTLWELAGVLGLTFKEERVELPYEPFIDLLVQLRHRLREEKKYCLADEIRSKLAELGIALEDTKEKTIWRHKRS